MTHSSEARPSPARVMVVDDSPITRRLMENVLGKADGIELVAMLDDGRDVVKRALKEKVDLVVMDLDMPQMGGEEALGALSCAAPNVGVIIYSGAPTTTLDALERDHPNLAVIGKGSGAGGGIEALKERLVPLVRKIYGKKCDPTRVTSTVFVPSSRRREAKVAVEVPPAPLPASVPAPEPGAAASSRSARPRRSRVGLLVIGSSTGGPDALHQVLSALPGNFPVPIAIVQHMPIGFTAQLAARLDGQCAIEVTEAETGVRLQAGCAIIAPAGKHLEVHQDGPHLKTRLTEAEPENSCRPAVDVLFRTAAKASPKDILSVVLTGMGQDGLIGAGDLRRTGGKVLVQDEATSVVWGMPGAISKAGLADEVLPLQDIADRIVELACRPEVGPRRSA